MILSEGYIRDLFAAAAARLELPPGCAVVLEGSIAEGFGNESSDIDFLVIAEQDRDLPGMPTILFVDGRRVEVRFRSVRQVREHTATVLSAARSPGRLREDELNRVQRLAGSFPLI